MISHDLYFTFIKIPINHKCLLVCKYWHKNIIGDIKKRKIEFYDMQLYNAINNKHIFILYSTADSVLLQAYDNIIINIMKIIIKDPDIKDKIMDRFIENYKQLSIIISIFNNYNYNTMANAAITANAKDTDNIEKYIADEYANILNKYYNYHIILT
jgi:hypothetical protein